MGFTDNCDVFAAVHEDGFNRIIGHIRRQRPSLFNYATAFVAGIPEMLCKAIDAHPIVTLRNNPLVTLVEPLPIPGTNYGVNFAVQLADLRIDFHPGDEFNLPPELASLQEQRLAIKLTICGGIGCPPDDIIRQLIPPPEIPQSQIDVRMMRSHLPTNPTRAVLAPSAEGRVIPLPTRELICFCLDAFATGGIRIVTYHGLPYLEPHLDGFEIVDIKPKELENSLECYMGLILKLAVLPGLRILLKHMPLNLTQGATDFFPQPTNVTLSPVPVSAAVPNNPAIEQDQVKVFIKAEVH